ncbi:sugar ABC transporter ATP-binding protein [Nakamurella antarctica]|uniref:Sugar ABC transporter ATP-binding protein n=1 Tax=Nakamurella antarctica TaxID=1902245 RepID=A0A3G8ZTE0_9ACTN|nr:sugar ABC transporter ATP-binding protein [Nakamurella antarctica]AZI57061.1 sugar ABC transporter ATP-binding protein [Nakamurella antarctica]
MATTISITGLTKTFTGARALRGVDLAVDSGEVLALLGENGAGKSTLLKILSGDYTPDGGTILLDGEPTNFKSAIDGRRSGIRVIAQEPEIIKDVSVAENIFVGSLPHRGRIFSASTLRARAISALEKFGFADVLNADALGSTLSPAQRQIVEIMRALVDSPRVIAFDEPTSSLTENEVNALFRLIRRLRTDGVAIIYVSHRMHEIFEIADRVAILRDGELAGVRMLKETSESELVRLMVGRELSSLFERRRVTGGAVVLAVDDLTNDLVHNASLTVRAGEVVALAGLIGAGRSELARTIIGDLPHASGSVSVAGKQLSLRSPRDAIQAGIGLVPEERKAQALLLQRSVRDNISLSILDRITSFRIVKRAQERLIVQGLADRMRVRTPDIETEVGNLSGGNQQKVVLGRWLARKPKVLILDEPTRGVDVGAKAEIYAVIDQLANDGMAILVISSELPEVLGLADRILVMQGGRIVGELDHTQASEEAVLSLALPHSETATL